MMSDEEFFETMVVGVQEEQEQKIAALEKRLKHMQHAYADLQAVLLDMWPKAGGYFRRIHERGCRCARCVMCDRLEPHVGPIPYSIPSTNNVRSIHK